MIEFVVTSSVLIAVIIALRYLFQGKISRRLQYALWGLVLLRLLMPFPLFGSQFSIMNMLNKTGTTEAASEIQVQPDTIGNTIDMPDVTGIAGDGVPQATQGNTVESANSQLGNESFSDAQVAAFGRTLGYIWLSGSIAMALWFAYTNIIFYMKLRKTRQAHSISGCSLSVYTADGLVSPCLFGIVHPAIYLTSKAADDEASTGYVLAHEQCHYRHGDHIWSLFRGLCLAALWWNPLVWVAAILSRIDGELACDESVIRQLGEDSRLGYGRTLVDMIAVKKEPAGILCAATAMSAGKRGIKLRLNMILKKPKTVIPAVAAVILIAAVCVSCTFTGANATRVTAEKALEQLVASVERSESHVSFQIPKAYEKAEDWNIHIAGRLAYEDGFSQSVHHLEAINDAKAWEPGKHYEIPLDKNYAELTLTASLRNENNETLEKSIHLIDPAVSIDLPKVDMIFFSESTDLDKLGRTAAEDYYRQFTGDNVPQYWHITKYEILSSKLIAGDEKEFAVWVTSSVETDGGGFLIGEGIPNDPDDISKGGICPEVGRQFRIKALGNGQYEIVSIGTGGGDQGLAPVEATVSYGIMKLMNGEVLRDLSLLSGDNAQLAGAVIMNYMLKSAAWPGVDITTLEECYLLRAADPDGTTKDYYAYLVDGNAVLQYGADGQYSRIDDGLYEKLVMLANSNTSAADADVSADPSWDSEQAKLEVAVSNATISVNADNYHKDDFSAEAHTTLGVEVHGSTTTVYAMVLHMLFNYAGGGFSEAGGSHSPIAMTFEKNNVGDYVLTEYWRPDDGSYYAPSIKEKFPADIYEDALDTQKYITAHVQACYAQAIEYGKVDTAVHLAKLIESICSSPSSSSNPGDYIDAHPIEYREMLYYGHYTLDYCFALFELGGQTGLEGHIMASACRDILGETASVDVPVANGQEWYDALKKFFKI